MATYLAIKELSEENKEYPILELCKLGKVSRAAYYKWLNRIDSPNDKLNKIIAKKNRTNAYRTSGYGLSPIA